MAESKNSKKETTKELGYSANQSTEILKGYGAKRSVQTRNEDKFDEGYSAHQTTTTANSDKEQGSKQTSSSDSDTSSDST